MVVSEVVGVTAAVCCCCRLRELQLKAANSADRTRRDYKTAAARPAVSHDAVARWVGPWVRVRWQRPSVRPSVVITRAPTDCYAVTPLFCARPLLSHSFIHSIWLECIASHVFSHACAQYIYSRRSAGDRLSTLKNHYPSTTLLTRSWLKNELVQSTYNCLSHACIIVTNYLIGEGQF